MCIAPQVLFQHCVDLKINKGSAPLQGFVQQSNHNRLDERKAVWKGLDRTPTEVDSNDDLIT